MPTKKKAMPKTAAKPTAVPAKKTAPPAPAKKAAAKAAPPARPAPKAVARAKATAPDKAAAPVKVAAKSAPKPAPKSALKTKAAPVKTAPPPKPATKPVKPASKAKPAQKPSPKAEPKAKPPVKAAVDKASQSVKPKPAAKAPATKSTPIVPTEAKPEAKAKAVKAPKPPKPLKLAPVEAAFAKPKPAKPLAVAAGRAQPMVRLETPTRPLPPPKTLATPKPVASEPELVGDLQPVPAFKGKAGAAKGLVLVGAVAGAFGVKGEVRLRAFTEKKEGVVSYGPLYSEDGKLLMKPKSWRELKDGVAVVAAEVKSKEQADSMRGQRLYVPRANLPAPPEDEFYIVDLLGCSAETVDGKVLGEICAVWNFGAGDIIEYRPPNGGPNVRITFTKESAPLVDLAGKRVVLDPPAPEPVGK